MARNIRWQVTFKSLNGTTCRVNIYDNDWPASTVMPVRGAADPFFFEEDNSDDILNDVIRYRTGYIRIIENYFGELDAIYPTSMLDRYVEFLYGSTVMFTGYIQMLEISNTQEFSSSSNPCPREVELPVISPLGLYDQRTFTVTPFNPPSAKTLGELLDIVMNLGGYEKVTFPNITNTGLDKEIYSLVVCPYNPDHHYSVPNVYVDRIFKPETYAYLIECICKAYGWICHDTPEALVFTSFDHKGQYSYYLKGHIGESGYKQNESITQTEEALTNHYTLADAKAVVRKLLPDTGIEVNYEGNSVALDFSFERTYFHSVKMQTARPKDEINSFCNLTAATQLQEITGCGALDFSNDNKIPAGCAIVAWNGNEGILRSFSSSLTDGYEMFKIRFYTPYVADREYSVKYDVMTSDWDIAELQDDTDEYTLLHFGTQLTIAHNYVEVKFIYHVGQEFEPGYFVNPFPDYFLAFFKNIRLEIYDDDEPYTEYKVTPSNKSDVIPANGIPAISSDITMPISMYRENDHMIGDTVLTTKVTEYPYLFQQRTELEGVFRGTAPNLYHARMWEYLGKKWRIIAQTFHPWSDECRLTLQSSPVLDGSTHTITASAANTSLDGYSDTVNDGTSFSHLLSASTAYNSSTGQIYIASVTGNVVITVVATEASQYDAKVEYLESDGYAYIDLLNTLDSDKDMVDIDFMLVASGTAARFIFGDRASASSKNFTALVSSSNSIIIDINNGSYSTYRVNAGTSGVNKRCIIHMEKSNKYIEYDGSMVASSTTSSQSFTTNSNAFLFGAGDNSRPKIKLYSFQWRREGILLYNFIPVRKDGVGYLYDKVSGTLFGNANSSGSFTYGPDKNS